MIGGLTLLMAIGAMLLVTLWADAYDDLADAAPRRGFFAMTAGRAKRPDGRKRRGAASRRRGRAPPDDDEETAVPGPRSGARPAPRRVFTLLHEAEAAEIAAEIAEMEEEAEERRLTGRRGPPLRRAFAPGRPEEPDEDSEERALQAEALEAARAARARRDDEAMEQARRRFGGLA